MRISTLFAAAGKYGTVVVEAVSAVLIGLGALYIRRNIVLPLKEDTRAELVERGYTLDEIKEAEGTISTRLADAVRAMVSHHESVRLQETEDAESIDIPQDISDPQTAT